MHARKSRLDLDDFALDRTYAKLARLDVAGGTSPGRPGAVATPNDAERPKQRHPE